MKVMVLAGGPDQEREVSLMSGEQVARSLEKAGHDVVVRDIGPRDESAIDAYKEWGGDVIFPVLHGKWGEGGSLQMLLEKHQVRFVGCNALAARLCMDKQQTKCLLEEKGIPTPRFEVVRAVDETTLKGELVVKAIDEGSSIDLYICRTQHELEEARHLLHKKHERLMVEEFIDGRELTVSVIVKEKSHFDYEVLPVLEIKPATEFYDYQAKYIRDDTEYSFDTGFSESLTAKIQELARQTHVELGARHLSRVDFMLSKDEQPFVLEVNTMPGCTTHSLLPMAAREAGIPMPELVDRLVCAAMQSVVVEQS